MKKNTETILRETCHALVRQSERYKQDAVAYRFYVGESIEAIAKRYELSYRDIEQALRDYMNRKRS
jgi:uncharacterized protein (DUF433 family)